MAKMRFGMCCFAFAAFACGCATQNEETIASAIARYELARSPKVVAAAGRRGQRKVVSDSPSVDPIWLAMTDRPADGTGTTADTSPDTSPKETTNADRPFVPWRERRGPAYPGDFWRSFGRDAKEFLPLVWDDTMATGKSPFAWTMLAAAGATGIALSGNRGNDQVADHFTRNGSQLNTFWDTVGDVGGNPGAHFGFAGALYLTSLARGDDRNYEAAKSLLSALSINGLATMALKVAARTESPNGDEFGWPSGHTSSSFCFAAVMYEHYGPWAGVPLYAFAAFVGYERIDARNHDFADVISGALIGMAIGHAVAQNHQPRVLGMDIIPYADPRGGAGIALMKRW